MAVFIICTSAEVSQITQYIFRCFAEQLATVCVLFSNRGLWQPQPRNAIMRHVFVVNTGLRGKFNIGPRVWLLQLIRKYDWIQSKLLLLLESSKATKNLNMRRKTLKNDIIRTSILAQQLKREKMINLLVYYL